MRSAARAWRLTQPCLRASLFVQALEILTRELGPKDPRTACAEYNLGTVLSGAGDDEAAQARARASVQRLGPQPRSRPARWHACCRPPVRSLAAWPHGRSDTAQRRVRPRGWLRAGMRWLMLTGVCRRQSCHLKEGPQQGGSSSKRDAGAVAGVRGGRYTFRSAWTRGAPCWGRGTRAPWTRCRRWPPAQAAAKPRSRSSTRTWRRSRPPARQTLQARAAPAPVGKGGRGLGCERGAPGSGRSPGRCGCARHPSERASSLPAALRRSRRPHCITLLRQHHPLHALHG